MNYRLIVPLAAAVVLCACRSSKVKISGHLIGGESSEVYLEQVTPLLTTIVDTASLDAQGRYEFRVSDVGRTPVLYHVVAGSERIPLFIAGGERIVVNAVGSIVRNYTVEGSEESESLRRFYQPFVAGAQQLDRIAARFAAPDLTETERQELLKSYTEEYYRIRREQLRFIIENRSSLAAVYALYQRLPGDRHLSDGENDAIYYRTVAEALAERYPESPYLTALKGEIERMDVRHDLASQITETNFPDLELTDIYGKRIRLSSLAGKVVLLDFWSAELGRNNALNAELKQTYEKYADAEVPFEVYQVAVDTSKPLWISAVQEQRLPWISVSDLRGRNSPALGIYNVRKLPANFLIDKEGAIVAKDIYGRSLDEKLQELTR